MLEFAGSNLARNGRDCFFFLLLEEEGGGVVMNPPPAINIPGSEAGYLCALSRTIKPPANWKSQKHGMGVGGEVGVKCRPEAAVQQTSRKSTTEVEAVVWSVFAACDIHSVGGNGGGTGMGMSWLLRCRFPTSGQGTFVRHENLVV